MIFRKIFLLVTIVAMAALIPGCSDDDEVEVEPQFKLSSESLTLSRSEGSKGIVRFASATDWEATTSADWISLSKSEGIAGSNTIVVSAAETNTSTEVRSAQVTISHAGVSVTVTVTQQATGYVSPETQSLSLSAEGDTVILHVATNADFRNLVATTTADSWWFSISMVADDSVGEDTVCYRVVATENLSSARTGEIRFMLPSGVELYKAASVTVSQEAVNIPHSTDFSADKSVTTIQKATAGERGLPLVLMGDAFLDTDIADGTYDKVMRQAVSNLFSEPVMTALKDYFDIYYVSAVSSYNRLGSSYSTAFSSVLAGGGSTTITGDDEAVLKYLRAVPNVDEDNALAVVIINTNDYAGTTYFGFKDDDNKNYVDFALAFCPVIDSVAAPRFRQVLNHEAVGHGLAKLYDEYYYTSNGSPSRSDIAEINTLQAQGWGANIDLNSVVDSTRWADLAADSYFESEALGAYEGAATFAHGVYRPTENSIMRHNTLGFNAPSRRAIFNRVMEYCTGATPTYDEFKAFDSTLDNSSSESENKSLTVDFVPFGAPVVANYAIGK